ncbi:hypothetical protein [uncultured Endozoicomonas sp.]|uniref:hypothetical protein n=1 Tax=uncultured Endozoicomonas sp. TaxID=432652 RepID=UPI00262CE5C7|nr:hypothetical protein [uncultured Endozoicomonas sp.]
MSPIQDKSPIPPTDSKKQSELTEKYWNNHRIINVRGVQIFSKKSCVELNEGLTFPKDTLLDKRTTRYISLKRTSPFTHQDSSPAKEPLLTINEQDNPFRSLFPNYAASDLKKLLNEVYLPKPRAKGENNHYFFEASKIKDYLCGKSLNEAANKAYDKEGALQDQHTHNCQFEDGNSSEIAKALEHIAAKHRCQIAAQLDQHYHFKKPSALSFHVDSNSAMERLLPKSYPFEEVSNGSGKHFQVHSDFLITWIKQCNKTMLKDSHMVIALGVKGLGNTVASDDPCSSSRAFSESFHSLDMIYYLANLNRRVPSSLIIGKIANQNGAGYVINQDTTYRFQVTQADNTFHLECIDDEDSQRVLFNWSHKFRKIPPSIFSANDLDNINHEDRAFWQLQELEKSALRFSINHGYLTSGHQKTDETGQGESSSSPAKLVRQILIGRISVVPTDDQMLAFKEKKSTAYSLGQKEGSINTNPPMSLSNITINNTRLSVSDKLYQKYRFSRITFKDCILPLEALKAGNPDGNQMIDCRFSFNSDIQQDLEQATILFDTLKKAPDQLAHISGGLKFIDTSADESNVSKEQYNLNLIRRLQKSGKFTQSSVDENISQLTEFLDETGLIKGENTNSRTLSFIVILNDIEPSTDSSKRSPIIETATIHFNTGCNNKSPMLYKAIEDQLDSLTFCYLSEKKLSMYLEYYSYRTDLAIEDIYKKAINLIKKSIENNQCLLLKHLYNQFKKTNPKDNPNIKKLILTCIKDRELKDNAFDCVKISELCLSADIDFNGKSTVRYILEELHKKLLEDTSVNNYRDVLWCLYSCLKNATAAEASLLCEETRNDVKFLLKQIITNIDIEAYDSYYFIIWLIGIAAYSGAYQNNEEGVLIPILQRVDKTEKLYLLEKIEEQLVNYFRSFKKSSDPKKASKILIDKCRQKIGSTTI